MLHTAARMIATIGLTLWMTTATLGQDLGDHCVDRQSAQCHTSLTDLAQMSWPQLCELYRSSQPGEIPTGYVKGRSFVPPEKCLHGFRSRMINALWQGKHFCAADCSVINQWRIGRAIRGDVYYGTSWIDGKPALIIDYRDTSRIWSDARDEMREVAPGLYVGVMHRRQSGRTFIKYYFVLESQ